MWVTVAAVPRGQLASLDTARPRHRRGNRQRALEVDGVALHAVIDRERHPGWCLPAPLEVFVHLPEQRSHRLPDLGHPDGRSDTQDRLRGELYRPTFRHPENARWTDDAGPCHARADHSWGAEWRARDPWWHNGAEYRTACRRCGLRRARIVDAPDTGHLNATVVVADGRRRPIPGCEPQVEELRRALRALSARVTLLRTEAIAARRSCRAWSTVTKGDSLKSDSRHPPVGERLAGIAFPTKPAAGTYFPNRSTPRGPL